MKLLNWAVRCETCLSCAIFLVLTHAHNDGNGREADVRCLRGNLEARRHSRHWSQSI